MVDLVEDCQFKSGVSSRCLIEFYGSEDLGKDLLVHQLSKTRRVSSGQVRSDKEIHEFIKGFELMNPKDEGKQERIHRHGFVPEFDKLLFSFAHPPNYLI